VINASCTEQIAHVLSSCEVVQCLDCWAVNLPTATNSYIAGCVHPLSCKGAVLRRWVFAAGGNVDAAEGVEVSPTVSYAGEGLFEICRGRRFAQPHDAALQVRRNAMIPTAVAPVRCTSHRTSRRGLRQCPAHPIRLRECASSLVLGNGAAVNSQHVISDSDGQTRRRSYGYTL
jgi:hypothetical protein